MEQETIHILNVRPFLAILEMKHGIKKKLSRAVYRDNFELEPVLFQEQIWKIYSRPSAILRISGKRLSQKHTFFARVFEVADVSSVLLEL